MCSNDLFWLNSNILGTGQYTFTNYLLKPFLSWFKIYEELCFVFFCIYIIAVLFCLFLFSSLQIWVISDFLDSPELCCVFDFNVLIKIDGVLDRWDNLILNGNIYWRWSCICNFLRTNDWYGFSFLWVSTKVDKIYSLHLFLFL